MLSTINNTTQFLQINKICKNPEKNVLFTFVSNDFKTIFLSIFNYNCLVFSLKKKEFLLKKLSSE